MQWKKVNLRAKNKNLPQIGETVLWAVKGGKYNTEKWINYLGKITKDMYIDIGIDRIKLTSKYFWSEIQEPKEELI